MIETISDIAFALLGLAATLVVIRIVRGPSLADRVLGLDVLTMLGAAAIALFAFRTGFGLFMDLAVAVIFVGFVSTAAFARYLLSRGEP